MANVKSDIQEFVTTYISNLDNDRKFSNVAELALQHCYSEERQELDSSFAQVREVIWYLVDAGAIIADGNGVLKKAW